VVGGWWWVACGGIPSGIDMEIGLGFAFGFGFASSKKDIELIS
jgi:hypothetical protein